MRPEFSPRRLCLGLALLLLCAVFAAASLAQQRRTQQAANAPVIVRAPNPNYDPFGPGPPETREAPTDPFSSNPNAVLVPDGGGAWKEVPRTWQPEAHPPHPTDQHTPGPPPVPIPSSPGSYGPGLYSR